MFEVWFSNSANAHNQGTQMCQCPDFYTAMAVWDALSRRYMHVTVYDTQGAEVRKYYNF